MMVFGEVCRGGGNLSGLVRGALWADLVVASTAQWLVRMDGKNRCVLACLFIR